MSYNMRRTYNSPSQQQRRPNISNNFVHGGQLANPQQSPARNQQTGINFRNQQNSQQQQQQRQNSQPAYNSPKPNPQQQQQQRQSSQPAYNPPKPQLKQEAPTPVKPAPPPVQSTPTPPPVQPKTVPPPVQPKTVPPPVQPKTVPPPTTPAVDPTPPSPMEEEKPELSADDILRKKLWFKNRGKITKAEKARRRNVRLSKVLQPKNAVMVLNELVKGCQYIVDEATGKVDSNQFKASVQFEGQEFVGTGRTKIGAKNIAAEVALKYLIKTKQFKLKKEEEENGEDEKMEISEEENQEAMPWSHIASFAMYKLFTSWGEDPSLANKAQEILSNSPKAPTNVPHATSEARPAKKMPDNPEKINPLMLMNQMLPHAEWEEIGKSGTPPNVIFQFRVTVNDQSFTGSGTNKKAAKKVAAFAACNEILNIAYPPEVWVPGY